MIGRPCRAGRYRSGLRLLVVTSAALVTPARAGAHARRGTGHHHVRDEGALLLLAFMVVDVVLPCLVRVERLGSEGITRGVQALTLVAAATAAATFACAAVAIVCLVVFLL